MKTSRKDGILVLNTSKPYRMHIDGDPKAERTEIICHEPTSKCEAAAFDIEQQLLVAMSNIPAQNKQAYSKKQIASDEKKESAFFDTDSPSEESIKEQGTAMEMMVKMNNSVKLSTIMETFNDFLLAGNIRIAGDIPMSTQVWDTISRQDKSMIVFRYCAFFVNPLTILRDMGSSTDTKESSDQTRG